MKYAFFVIASIICLASSVQAEVSLVHVGQTHNVEAVREVPPQVRERILLSQRNIQTFLLEESEKSTNIISVFVEGVDVESIAFVQDTKEYCADKKYTAQSFSNRWGSDQFISAVTVYCDLKKKNRLSVSDEENILLNAGATWKLYCDGRINLLPVNSRASGKKAQEAILRIGVLRRRLEQQLWTVIESGSDSEYQLYLQANANKTVTDEHVFAYDLRRLSETLQNQSTIALLRAGISEIEVEERAVFFDREVDALSAISQFVSANRNQSRVILVYGQSHQFRIALDSVRSSLNYIRVAS